MVRNTNQKLGKRGELGALISILVLCALLSCQEKTVFGEVLGVEIHVNNYDNKCYYNNLALVLRLVNESDKQDLVLHQQVENYSCERLDLVTSRFEWILPDRKYYLLDEKMTGDDLIIYHGSDSVFKLRASFQLKRNNYLYDIYKEYKGQIESDFVVSLKGISDVVNLKKSKNFKIRYFVSGEEIEGSDSLLLKTFNGPSIKYLDKIKNKIDSISNAIPDFEEPVFELDTL